MAQDSAALDSERSDYPLVSLSTMAAPSLLMVASGVTADLYRAAIGPRGQDYYLNHFIQFDNKGRTGVSWHWPAYWNTLNWLLYRKMWGAALAYLGAVIGLALLVFGLGKLIFDYSNMTGLVLFLLFLSAAFVIPGLYANAWYYGHCHEKISEALRETPDVSDACARLLVHASTNRRWWGLFAMNIVLLAMMVGFGSLLLRPSAQELQVMQARDEAPVVAAPPAKTEPAAGSAAAPAATEPVVSASAVPAEAAASANPVTAGVTSPAKLETFVAHAEPAPQAPAAPVAPTNAVAPAASMQAAAPAPAVAVSAGSTRASPATAAASPSWYVQAGAFAQQANADKVLARLQGTGMTVRAEPVQNRAGAQLTRIRVGPFASKAEADQAVARIKGMALPAVTFRD